MTKAARTRQFIIETTAPIFNKKGYEGTSISDITTATGLTKGSVYGNFRDKDELAAEAFDYNHNIIKNEIVNRSLGLKDPVEQLLVYVNFYSEVFEKVYVAGGCPLLNTAVDTDDSNPELFGRVQKAMRDWYDHVQSVVMYGIKKEIFRPETDAEAFANHFVSLIEGGMLLSKTFRNKKYLNSNLELIRRMISEMTG
ncbi:TetR/AcrR family transcriptional regulator [Fluviicola chungangensis]|uniref:TetR/AcrR family transcriptional regulator n=1 Tax=Fluviicola chungangensis TaxID=2597671 RepID=A0A556MYP9_9FLAO|nr:TetR/AcrR family transcriptional regulator [Fluviicola chungangensis]TSJ44909.1 TetR/AcrR family transcriptional regulator [Fluviicola chungangensis]